MREAEATPQRNRRACESSAEPDSLSDYLPAEVREPDDPQTAIPRMARDANLVRLIEAAVRRIPTVHDLYCEDARKITNLASESVHLVVTSPPYWTLKEYRDTPGQMGRIVDYEEFLDQLDKVWEHCYRMLVPGGRLVCVVGDVCLSRRKNAGRHTVVQLHASIQEHCRRIG